MSFLYAFAMMVANEAMILDFPIPEGTSQYCLLLFANLSVPAIATPSWLLFGTQPASFRYGWTRSVHFSTFVEMISSFGKRSSSFS